MFLDCSEMKKARRGNAGPSDQDSLAQSVSEARGWSNLISVSVMLTGIAPVKLPDHAMQRSNSMARKDGRERAKLTDDIIRKIWSRLSKGEYQHDIAADLGVNQGRISEVKTGKRGSHITGLRPA